MYTDGRYHKTCQFKRKIGTQTVTERQIRPHVHCVCVCELFHCARQLICSSNFLHVVGNFPPFPSKATCQQWVLQEREVDLTLLNYMCEVNLIRTNTESELTLCDHLGLFKPFVLLSCLVKKIFLGLVLIQNNWATTNNPTFDCETWVAGKGTSHWSPVKQSKTDETLLLFILQSISKISPERYHPFN